MAEQNDVLTLLTQLEAERAELDVTIAHLRRRMGLSLPDIDSNGAPGGIAMAGVVGRDTSVTGRVRPDEFFRLSQRDAIIKYLNIMKQPQSPMSIVKGLKAGGVLSQAKNFYANVNTELKRMKARNVVVNTASGWGLAEWYPQKPKNEPVKPQKKKKSSGKAAIAKRKVERKSSVAPTINPDKMNWHQFLGASAKAGKTMEEAAAAWKQRKAALA